MLSNFQLISGFKVAEVRGWNCTWNTLTFINNPWSNKFWHLLSQAARRDKKYSSVPRSMLFCVIGDNAESTIYIPNGKFVSKFSIIYFLFTFELAVKPGNVRYADGWKIIPWGYLSTHIVYATFMWQNFTSYTFWNSFWILKKINSINQASDRSIQIVKFKFQVKFRNISIMNIYS